MSDLAVTIHKLHATANDFLVVDARDIDDPVSAVRASALCDRRTGIGADGIITIGSARTEAAHVSMRLRNADGEIAQMSGNGIRCVARVAADAGLGTRDTLLVDTDAGLRSMTLTRDERDRVVAAEVDMGAATFDPAAIPIAAESPFDLECLVGQVTVRGDAVGMGNPHFVVPVADPATTDVALLGPAVEHSSIFPERTNVEFVHRDAPDRIRMRVWERGVGETRSCGTGACAVAAAAFRRDLVGPDVTIVVPGGELRVRIGATIYLGGPVTPIFKTEVRWSDWSDSSGPS